MIKTINQLVVFIIELIMIGTVACVGFREGNATWTKYSLAIILPLIVILLWGHFAAPKSSHRLKMPYLAMFRLALFLATACLLFRSHQTIMALVVALLSVVTQIVSYFLKE